MDGGPTGESVQSVLHHKSEQRHEDRIQAKDHGWNATGGGDSGLFKQHGEDSDMECYVCTYVFKMDSIHLVYSRLCVGSAHGVGPRKQVRSQHHVQVAEADFAGHTATSRCREKPRYMICSNM